VTKSVLLQQYEGREDDIDWDKLPPDIEDFPYDVQKAIVSYNKFGDKVIADLGYLGKDFTLLETLIEVEGVLDKDIFLESLLRLDQFFIEKSRKDMETARQRAKRGKS
jgi:hypothetical protein